MSAKVFHIPNDGPAIREIWAFVSRDSVGRENVIAGTLPIIGMTPLMTGNPKTFEIYKRIVRDALEQLEAGGQTIHLLRFTERQEVEPW